MPRKQATKKRKLPEGMYEMHIKGRKAPIIVHLQAIPIGVLLFEMKLDEPDPNEGQERFFVCCSKLSVYTSIGADNVHHASNKATKLFGPHWTSLTKDAYLVRGYEHCTVAGFSELLRTL